MEPFVGEVSLFGFEFFPRGWAFANGASLSIAQNSGLYSLIGATYGGDSQTFRLPNLSSRNPVGQGQGPGLTNYPLGAAFGAAAVTLTSQQIPIHSHGAPPVVAGAGTGRTGAPTVSSALAAPVGTRAFRDGSAETTLSPAGLGGVGGSQPHSNRQPYLGLNYAIALIGIFPSRP